jgi:hypothetical protein
MESFRSRARFGTQVGLVLALVPSAWVTIAHFVTSGASLEARGLSLPVVLLVYFSSALVGGVIYGLSGPLFQSRMGAAVGGFLIAVPLFTAIAISLPGEDLDVPRTWRTIVLAAAFLGGLTGFIHWEPN